MHASTMPSNIRAASVHAYRWAHAGHRLQTYPLNFSQGCAILVSMTRIQKTNKPAPHRRRTSKAGQWLLQDAKARFSELVRRVRSEGPQRVTVHGRDEVVVISAEEFRRLKGDLTGKALIVAMQASPYREIDIEPGRAPMPVRKVSM
jgi:prevent-host-death family protein